MHPISKVAISSICWSAMLINQVQAYLPPISFENPGYYPGQSIGGASGSGWNLISGNAKISPNGTGVGGGQALKLEVDPQQEPLLKREIDWDISESTAFIDLQLKPAADPEGSLASFHANGTQLAFQVPLGGSTGEIWVYNGSAGEANPAQWAKTVGTFALASGGLTASDYTRITLRHDYQRNVWDLFIAGKLAAANLAFEGRGANLEDIELYGSKTGDTLIDDLSADTGNMLFPDADKDGLPDAWEIANGSNPNLYDRDNIKPGTGKPFLDLYMDSLWLGGLNGSAQLPPQGGIPPLTVMNSHQPVGSLKGSFTVSGDGSANYSIPIDIPKGTGGMEPKISLSYSSGSGNGIVGLGFALSGLQVITRGLATYRKDGFSGAIGQNHDRFYLNGERLVCVAGAYGAAGSEYRTEIDSFARITLASSAQSGTSSWRVETKAGLIIDFGSTADSRVLSSGSVPLSWFVTKVSDTVGNYYLVNYESEPSGNPVEILNHRVKNIKYTGNTASGTAPYSTIAFSYEIRPDVIPTYSQGSKFTTSCRLKELEVSTGGAVNHRYSLDYEISPKTSRSRLTKIQRFQVGGEAVPPTVIKWSSKSDTQGRTKWRDSARAEQNNMEWNSGATSYSKFIDMNGDGLLDRADHNNYATGQSGLWVALNTSTGFLPMMKWYGGGTGAQNCPESYSSSSRLSGLLDMNGDGLPDRVDHYDYQSNQYGLWVSINTGSGFNPKSNWYTSSRTEQNYLEWSAYSTLIDLNGDGLPDKAEHYNYETNEPGIWVSLNTGSGFDPKSRWYLGSYTSQNLMKWASGNTVYSGFYDVNGDGRPDRVDHQDYTTATKGIWVSLNTGSDFAPKTKWYTSSKAEQHCPEWGGSGFRSSGFTDMNGDGLPDRIDHYNYEENLPGLWVSLNTGTGFAAKTRWYLGSHTSQNLLAWSGEPGTYSMLLDLNGDGLPDKLDHYDYATNTSGLWVSLNTGNGFATKRVWYQGSHSNQNIPRWSSYSDFVDMNADGLPDRVDHKNYTTGEAGLWVSLNQGTGFGEKTKWFTTTNANQSLPRWGAYSGFIDLNSDGLPDRLDHYNYQSGGYGFWISLNKGNGYNEFSDTSYGPEVISSVTDGFGSELKVEYNCLNDPTPTVGFNSRVYEKSTGTLPAGQFHVIDSRLVVSRYSEPNGMGGRSWRSQRYGDLRYDRNNETSLGFGWIEALDETNGQLTRTDNRRDYPFAGSPVLTQTSVFLGASDIAAMPPNRAGCPAFTVGQKNLSIETATYAEMPSQTGLGGTVRRPVQTGAVRQLFDLDGTLKGETTTTQNLADFDPYGFVKKSTVVSLDGSTIVTNNTYANSTTGGKWHLGRLGSATVTKTAPGVSASTKSSAFSYDTASGLLKTETVEPGHPLSVTTAYTHDSFGNVTNTAVTAGGQTRTSVTGYDTQGRFVTSEVNQLGHTVTYQYDAQRALLLSTTDMNGLTTSFFYDPFGTLIRTVHPDTTETAEVTGFASNSSVPSSVWPNGSGQNIVYFRAKQSSGTPVAKVYLDALGRELVTETTILRDGAVGASARYQKVYTVTTYDSQGRKVSVSDSFAAGETPNNTTVHYDLLSRTVSTNPTWRIV